MIYLTIFCSFLAEKWNEEEVWESWHVPSVTENIAENMLKFSHFSPLEFEISTWVTGKGMGEVWKVHGNYSIILYSCFTEVSLSQVWFFMLSEEKTVFFSFWCPLRNAYVSSIWNTSCYNEFLPVICSQSFIKWKIM